jgi:hypothetical protein
MRRTGEAMWGTKITFVVVLCLLAVSVWLAGPLAVHAL